MPDFDLDAELHRLATNARRQVNPPAPSEIRQLGNRRHQRRVALTTGTTMLAVVAATGIALATVRTDSAPPPPATTPSPTTITTPTTTSTPPSRPTVVPPVRGTDLSADDLLGAADASYALFGGRWQVTWTGEAQKPMTPCQPTASTGSADVTLQRTLVRGGSGQPPVLSQLLERHADAAAARRAYDRAVGWFATCRAPGAEGPAKVMDRRQLAGAGDRAEFLLVTPGLTQDDIGLFTEAGVTQVGSTLVVVVRDVYQQENYDPNYVGALLRIAAARVAGTPEPRVPLSSLVTSAEVGVPASKDARPDGTEPLSEEAGGIACGVKPEFPAWVPDANGIVAAYSREIGEISQASSDAQLLSQRVLVYASEAEAQRAVDRTRPTRERCRANGVGTLPAELAGSTLGDQSWTVAGGAAIRVGRAVAYVEYFDGGANAVTAEQARAAFEAVAKRMGSAFR